MSAEVGFEQSGDVGRKSLMQSYDTIVSLAIARRSAGPPGHNKKVCTRNLDEGEVTAEYKRIVK